MLANTTTRWGVIAQLFHWLMAFAILGAGAVGMYMTSLAASPQKFQIYALHKSVGLVLLGLVALRLAWRFANPTPKLPPHTPIFQRKVAAATHVALYGFMAAIPFTGYLMHSASSIPFKLFGVWTVPKLFAEPNQEILKAAKMAHEWLFIALLVLVALHIAAALKHHFVNRDDILKRMVPFTRSATQSLAGLLLVGLSATALAADWQVLPASRLGFIGSQSGTPFTGTFSRFDAAIRFDPAALDASQFAVTIDTTSVNTQNAERDEILATSDWFHLKQFTQATFNTTAFTTTGDPQFTATGELTIRGITRPVQFAFSWQANGNEAKLVGESLLDRRDFDVGIGEWATDEMVDYPVKVTVELALQKP